MRRTVTAVLIGLMSATPLLGQAISGTVRDAAGQPLEFVNIVAMSPRDSTFIGGTTSNEDGTFWLPDQGGKDLLIRLSSIGYATKYLPGKPEMGQVVLEMEESTLEETVITAQRALVKAASDRIIYDVSNDKDARTNRILEMLRKVPYVSVDANGNISIKGSRQIQIYENGRLNNSYTQHPGLILSAIPADMVDHFEVITEPGSRYDAEGVDGILNIVMKRHTLIKGVMGQAAASYESAQAMGNLYLATQIGKFSLAANYAGVYVTKENTFTLLDKDQTYRDSGSRILSGNSQSNPGWVHITGLDGSWEVDSLNLITFHLEGQSYDVDIKDGIGRTSLTDRQGNVLAAYRFDLKGTSQSFFDYNGKVDYQHLSARRPGEVLTISYLLSTSDTHTKVREAYTERQGEDPGYSLYRQDNDRLFVEHTFQTDWERPMGKGHSLNTGLKYILRSNSSLSRQIYDATEGQGSDFTHLTHIGALYAQYGFRSGAFSLQAGARWEYSYLKARFNDHSMDNYSRRLNDAIPFLSMGLSINERSALKMNYTSRVERPGITYLNPFRNETQLDISEGNPYLRSARPHRLSLGYSLIREKFQAGLDLSGSLTDNGITSLVRLEGKKIYTTFANIARRRQVTLGGFLRWQPFNGTDITLSLEGFRSTLENRSLDLRHRHNGWSGTLNISQELPWGIRMVLYGTRVDNPVSSLYYITEPYYSHQASLQRDFLASKRLTLRLSATNFLGSKYLVISSQNRLGEVIGSDLMVQRQRYLGLALSYRFGKISATVKKTGKSIQNDDLIGNR